MSEILVVKLGGTTIADQRRSWTRSRRSRAPASRRARPRRRQADHRLARAARRPDRFEGGLRVTDAAALEVAAAVLRGVVNSELVAGLRDLGVDAVGLSGVDGGLLIAERVPGLGLVAHVVGLRRDLLDAILVGGQVPVVAPLARDEDGIVCNVNADDAAAGIAGGLGARQLVLMTDVDGVRDADGRKLDTLTVDEAEDLIAAGVIAGGMVPEDPGRARRADWDDAEAVIADASRAGRPRPALDDPTFGTRLPPAARAGSGRHEETAMRNGTTAGTRVDRQRAIRELVARSDQQPGRARRAARRARLRGHPGDRVARHRGARPRQGRPRRPPRLRLAGGPRRPPAAVGRAPAPDPRRHPGHDRPQRAHPARWSARRARPASLAQAIDESTMNEQEGTLAGRQHAARPVPRRGAAGALARPVPGDRGPSRRTDGGHDEQGRPRLLGRARYLGRRRLAARAVRRRGRDADRRPRRRLAARRRRAPGDLAPAPPAYVVDARERFVTDFVWPHLQAGALYQGVYPLATALARPLIAQLLVEVAEREGADAVAHGCTGKGNDQVRFDVAVHALDPGLEVIAPMRVGMGLSRDEEIDYAIERGIEIPITKASPYSIDVNLWGRSIEAGVLEDPWVAPPADVYEWTVDPGAAPPPVEIVIGFEGGIPVSLDGERLSRSRSSTGSTSSAAPTASAGSTTSRTASSASRAARSTRRRRRRSCTPRTARSRG